METRSDLARDLITEDTIAGLVTFGGLKAIFMYSDEYILPSFHISYAHLHLTLSPQLVTSLIVYFA
uniref:Uncharacterized protein n=1 Tax=Parascaris univalens TaxID=6257 RepID=A0A915CCX5_PARUN